MRTRPLSPSRSPHCHTLTLPAQGVSRSLQGVSDLSTLHTETPRPRSIAHSARHSESASSLGRRPGVSRSLRDASRHRSDPRVTASVTTADAAEGRLGPLAPRSRPCPSHSSVDTARDSPAASMSFRRATSCLSWRAASPVIVSMAPTLARGARTGRLTQHRHRPSTPAPPQTQGTPAGPSLASREHDLRRGHEATRVPRVPWSPPRCVCPC